MTFLEQQTLFTSLIEDPGNVRWPLVAVVKRLLNQAYKDLARATGGLKAFVQFVPDPEAVPDVGAGTAAPYNYLGLYVPQTEYVVSQFVDLYLDATLQLEKCTTRQAFARYANWNDVAGDAPTLFVPHEVKRGRVFLVTQPTTALATLFGGIVYQHPDLAGDGDECHFPVEFHELPVYRAMETALAMPGDARNMEVAGYWGMRYRAGLAELGALAQRDHASEPARQRPRLY